MLRSFLPPTCREEMTLPIGWHAPSAAKGVVKGVVGRFTTPFVPQGVPPRRCVLFAAGLLLVMLAPAAAEDTVTIRTERGGRATLEGRIEDYDGQALRLVLPGGREQVIPAEKVLGVATTYTAEQTQADAAQAEGRLEQAVALYQQALRAEKRRWVRRQILVEMVWCYRGLGRTVPAGETFLLLMRDRPGEADFACMPLAWVPAQPTPELEQAARQWLAREDLPAAELLGASHLLSIDRSAALEHLKRLMVQADGVVAQLASAQAWRAEVVTATDETIAAWRTAIERMPEPLRSGPSYVLGQALARRGQWDRAALAMLEAPILEPRQRELAARALWDAGQALEKASRPKQAAGLYRELIEEHPDSPLASEARRRLEELL